MRILFDQNISYRILKLIHPYFPQANQVKNLNLEGAPDAEIWEFAKVNNFSIITFDADFADIANIKGCPPKIIWLRIGNMTTKNIAKILINNKDIIHQFITEKKYENICCLEIE